MKDHVSGLTIASSGVRYRISLTRTKKGNIEVHTDLLIITDENKSFRNYAQGTRYRMQDGFFFDNKKDKI